MKPFKRSLLVNPPVRRPNTDEVPSKVSQDGGSHLVAIPRGCGTVIGGPIAFDTGQIITGSVRMNDAEIDPKPGYADLRHHDPAFAGQGRRDRFLKWGLVAAD